MRLTVGRSDENHGSVRTSAVAGGAEIMYFWGRTGDVQNLSFANTTQHKAEVRIVQVLSMGQLMAAPQGINPLPEDRIVLERFMAAAGDSRCSHLQVCRLRR